jgi:chemotaxis protein MotB
MTAFLLPSCKMTSPLAKKVDRMFQSKRYKRAQLQLDSLKEVIVHLDKDTALLGNELRESDKNNRIERARYVELKDSYLKLKNSTSEKLAELAKSLDDKSTELLKKERTLRDQEKKLNEMQAILARQDSITDRLNEIVKDALLGFKSDELTVKVKNGKVYVSMTDKLLFKSGKATVESKGEEAIEKLSAVLNKNPELDVFIEGHTDNVPIKTELYKDNWDLSVARSTNIVRLMATKYQVSPKRLTASGKGEYFPVASNDSSEGRARNRRTEIILAPKLDELFQLLQKSKIK